MELGIPTRLLRRTYYCAADGGLRTGGLACSGWDLAYLPSISLAIVCDGASSPLCEDDRRHCTTRMLARA